MAKLRLNFISAYNERVEPLMQGIVQAEAIEIVPTYSHPSETFLRQLRDLEFPVGEMSMSSYLIARERGLDMIALPVFPSRRLFHTELSYHTDSGIEKPQDIVGKRIRVSADRRALAARHPRARLRRVAVQSALVYGAHRDHEPRRRDRLYAAERHLVSTRPAGQKPGVDAGE